MIIERNYKSTMTPFELNCGDQLIYTRRDGGTITIELEKTDASILERDYDKYGENNKKSISVYGFNCNLQINGKEIEISREVGSQKSFYEPLVIDGVNIWFDAARCIFDTSYGHQKSPGGFMIEKDFLYSTVCMPKKDARFVIQDASESICSESIDMWCELPHGGVRIEDCYCGSDCWMGPFEGAFAHGGLDINMPAGSLLHAPIGFDMQYYHTTLAAGFKNNCWHGFRQWEDNSIWRLSVAHIIDALVPEYTPMERGSPYATTAGTMVGEHEHTHFILHVTEQGGNYFLDPWIVFWQMLRDNELAND